MGFKVHQPGEFIPPQGSHVFRMNGRTNYAHANHIVLTLANMLNIQDNIMAELRNQASETVRRAYITTYKLSHISALTDNLEHITAKFLVDSTIRDIRFSDEIYAQVANELEITPPKKDV